MQIKEKINEAKTIVDNRISLLNEASVKPRTKIKEAGEEIADSVDEIFTLTMTAIKGNTVELLKKDNRVNNNYVNYLEEQTVDQLYQMAQECDIPYRSKMNKNQLIQILSI